MQCSAVPCGAVQWLFYHSMCFRLLPATIAAVALHVLLLLLLSSLLSSLFPLPYSHMELTDVKEIPCTSAQFPPGYMG